MLKGANAGASGPGQRQSAHHCLLPSVMQDTGPGTALTDELVYKLESKGY